MEDLQRNLKESREKLRRMLHPCWPGKHTSGMTGLNAAETCSRNRALSAYRQVFGLQRVSVHIQQHMSERQAQLYGSGLAVKHAGIAVPAFIRALYFGHFVELGVVAEDLQGAHVGANAAAETFFSVDYRGHIPSPSQK